MKGSGSRGQGCNAREFFLETLAPVWFYELVTAWDTLALLLETLQPWQLSYNSSKNVLKENVNQNVLLVKLGWDPYLHVFNIL